MSTSADRLTAARLLVRIDQGAFASRLLEAIPAPGVRTRVLGVLRRCRPLDGAIEAASGRPVDGLDPEVRATLRMALFEITDLGVPSAVAGDGAVRLIRRMGAARASGFVNAVIRRAPRAWERRMEASDIAYRTSHPQWLADRWIRTFGRPAAEASMAAAQDPAPVWVWFNRSEGRTTLEDEGITLEAHPWMPDAWRAVGNRLIGSLHSGDAYAQDPASQLVAWLAATLGAPGGSLVDLCAAPGGKTARAVRDLSWSAVVAADRHLGRLRLARSMFRRSGLAVWALVQDASRPALRPGGWDVVVLDAPCSGTGTLRRHPELRSRLQPGDIVERAALQRTLIDGALPLVGPGGVLLYSTCSVEAEENECLFERLPVGFDSMDLGSVLPPDTPAIPTSAGGVRLLPRPECDGFTVHALRRGRG